VTIASDQDILSTYSFSSGTITNPASTLTRPANTAAYAANQLIASSTTAASIMVPSFATGMGAGILPRLRLRTNAPSGWGGVNLSINLWSAAPTYTNGDGGAYAPATGSAAWLANFLILSLQQFGDGAIGSGGLTSANEMAFRLGATAVYWDLQILSAATPMSGQTFTLTAEVLS
jgi:hypothetical protein